MTISTPLVVTKEMSCFLARARKLAEIYCPEWVKHESHMNEDDPGLVFFKLATQLAERVASQINRIPEKQLLAFYDFLGIDYLPPVAAKVPLTFLLAAGSTNDVIIPVRTQVASIVNPKVVYETVEELNAMNNALKAIYSVNPWNNSYTCHTDSIGKLIASRYLFGGDASETSLKYGVYLADSAFGVPAPTDIKITYSYSSNEVEKTIFQFDGTKTIINGEEDFWLSLTGKNTLLPLSKELQLGKIRYSMEKERILPDVLLVNDSLVEPLKGFYPFGQMPKVGDICYIGCNEVFSKTGIMVALEITQIGGEVVAETKVKWEYLSEDSKWQSFENPSIDYKFDEPTRTISFNCPKIPIHTINGIASRWIRVVLESGGYNTPVSIDTEKCKITYPNYSPPFIPLLTLKYDQLTNIVQRCMVYNTLEYQEIEPEQDFLLYPAIGDYPVLFLGLEADPSRRQLVLYFSLQTDLYGDERTPFLKADTNVYNSSVKPEIHWFYYAQEGNWRELTVQDETDSLTQSGVVKLTVPQEMSEQSLFGQSLFWLKAEARAAGFCPSRLNGIYLNTVWAENAILIRDELLGTSNGEANQLFEIMMKPLLGAVKVEIRELAIPTAEELNTSAAEEGDDAWRTVTEENGEIAEVWVRWHEVSSFVFSNPKSRHYLIDRIKGQIKFGDGIHGMIPPIVPNNIYLREYKSGGGKEGNQEALAVTGLKTAVSHIDQVMNYDPATAGRDLESLTDLIERAPRMLKCLERAVTAEDFESLALEATPEIVKAKCFYEPGEHQIRIMILPYSTAELPEPKSELLSQVQVYLRERALMTLGEQIVVSGPAYQAIDITAKITRNWQGGNELTNQVQDRLRKYLNPIYGGNNGTGWDFGAGIFLSELAAIIKGVTGVESIVQLQVEKDGESFGIAKGAVILEADQLPHPGKIQISYGG